jgi:hypothetical protein
VAWGDVVAHPVSASKVAAIHRLIAIGWRNISSVMMPWGSIQPVQARLAGKWPDDRQHQCVSGKTAGDPAL